MGTTILERYRRTFQADKEVADRARELFPDGVTHDGRYVDPFPVYMDRALGSKKWGLNGRHFIDYWVGHGALLLGHSSPPIVEAVTRQVQRGTHYGASHRMEVEWADLVRQLIPSAERVRFVASGTEATLMAIRLARTFTGRKKVLKFAGHFHGWHDAVIPSSYPPFDKDIPGIPQCVLDATVVCPPNDIDAVAEQLRRDDDIACVMIEPTGGIFGTIPTNKQFIEPLRQLTADHGVVLVFDEVVTGFRVDPGGAQAMYGIMPDLTVLAKVLGGGLPCGALAGRKQIMDLISINEQRAGQYHKRMPHPGTFNANPLTAAAGIAMLNIIRTGQPQKHVNALAAKLRAGLIDLFDHHRLDWAAYGEYSDVKLLLGHGRRDVRAADFDPYQWDYRKLDGGDPDLARHLRCGLLLAGVDFMGNHAFLSTAHSDDDIDATIAAFDQTIGWMKADGLI